MTEAIPWPAARAAAHAAGRPLPPARLPLAEAAGGTLAAPLVAAVDLPGFDTAAMDGYAVAGPGPWRVRGCVLAGPPSGPRRLAAGEAVEIATGAVVPAGAAAVLPAERASRDGDRVAGPVAPGQHVRRAGETCRAGAALLEAGTPVTPALLGLAASVGLDAVEARPRPRVAAVLTGNEVVGAGVPPVGMVRDAVGPVLPGAVASVGGRLAAAAAVPDDLAAVRAAVQAADADVVLTVGMSARGPADHLRGVLRDLGATAVVDGVAVKPGHPMSLAALPDGRAVVGLPGNPLAALAAVLTLLAPLLAALGGRPLPVLPRAALAADGVRVEERVTRLAVVRLDPAGTAHATGHDRPALLLGAARGDAMAVVPPGWDRRTPVDLLPLPR